MRLNISFHSTLIIICLSLFASACKNEPPQYKNGKTAFFDLKKLFQNGDCPFENRCQTSQKNGHGQWQK